MKTKLINLNQYMAMKRFQTYKPKLNRYKVIGGTLVFTILLITPITPEFLILPKLIMWVMK